MGSYFRQVFLNSAAIKGNASLYSVTSIMLTLLCDRIYTDKDCLPAEMNQVLELIDLS